MTTPIFAYVVIFQPLAELASRLKHLYHRPHSVADSPRRSEPGRPQPVDIPPMISVVHDPDGDLRLVGVSGPITASNVVNLVDALDDLGDGLGLHLDLANADILGTVALRRVEATIDELERRGVRLRVVGVDPAHPALVAESHC